MAGKKSNLDQSDRVVGRVYLKRGVAIRASSLLMLVHIVAIVCTAVAAAEVDPIDASIYSRL